MKVGRREPRAPATDPVAAVSAVATSDVDAGSSRVGPTTDGELDLTKCDALDLAECTVHDGLRKLVQLLPRVMRGMRRHPGEPVVLEGVTLGPRHGSALALLRESESTVGGLAASLDLNLATVSGLVADLERVGFAERSNDPADRRRTIVRIPPGNEALVDAWLEGATAPLVRVLQQLSGEERTIFIKAMGFLETELNASQNAS